MTIYCFGELADETGTFVDRSPGRPDRIASCGADAYLAEQPATVPVDIDHGDPVGRVLHLERQSERHARLFVVAEVDDLVAEAKLAHSQRSWYWSPHFSYLGFEERVVIDGATLRSLALTTKPATISAEPVTFTRERPHEYHSRRLFARAAATMRQRARYPRTPLRIVELNRYGDPVERSATRSTSRHPAIHRTADMISGDRPGRTVSVR